MRQILHLKVKIFLRLFKEMPVYGHIILAAMASLLLLAVYRTSDIAPYNYIICGAYFLILAMIKMDGTILSRSSVSYLDSEQYFYPYINGRDYLKMFSAKNPGFDYESLCKLFNVPIDNFVDTYSDGMKKKLAIVATLALGKDVIMMDEPFNGLDLESVFLLQSALKRVTSKGKTV